MNNDTKSATPVAVIGLGCYFPRATGSTAYWHLLYHGKDAITDVPASHWSPSDYFDEDPRRQDHVYCRRGGFLSPIQFDPTEFGIPPSNLESTDTSQLIGLMAAKTALETAGYGSTADFDRDRTSVILGVTGTQELVIPLSSRLSWPKWKRALENAQVDPAQARQVMEALADEYVEWQENSFPGLLGNVVAGRICNRLDLNGTNCVVDAACASSMSAINLALLELYTGRSRMVVTGGVDTLNDIFMHMCFARTQILSPSGDARPFSQDADGTVLGEGVGILILKRLEDAERDGDRVLCVIKGIGSSSDGKSQSIYAPRAEGQLKALREAYASAGVPPPSVDLIEAHGTGTRVGDKIEVQALKMLFAEDREKQHCALGSVKSMVGHTKAAAGSAGIIKAVLALHHKVLPPTLKAERPDPEIGLEDSPFYLNHTTRPWFRKDTQPRRAGVSAFGFGGSNFHVVLEEHQPERTAVAWDGSIEIIALSAGSHQDLVRCLAKAAQSLLDHKSSDALAFQAAELRRTFDVQEPFRLLMMLQREEGDQGPSWNCDAVLKEARQGLDQSADQAFWFGRSSFFGQGPAPGPVVFVFPGQGSQYLQMGRDWVAWFPEALAALEKADRHFRGSTRLTDHIYPHVAEDQREILEKALRNTAVAQPAIGAVSIAMDKVLRRFGVVPEFTCGHSYGELTALTSAGWIEEETLFDLSVLRGQLMATGEGPEDTSRGTMTAVKAPLDKLAQLLHDENLDVVLANRNSPNQGVLSGSVASIERAEAACKAHKFRTVRLPVSAAFHSSLMAEAQAPFAAALQNVDFQPGKVGVFANTTGQPYPHDAAVIKKILGDHLLNPVNFVTEVDNLYQAGGRIFIEVGPKTVLTGLVRQILKGRDIHALATDAGSGRQFGIADLAVTLGKLAALGIPVQLMQWEGRNGNPRPPKMQIPISGANVKRANTRNPVKATTLESPPTAGESAQPPSMPVRDAQTAGKQSPAAAPVGKPHPDPVEMNPSTPITALSLDDAPTTRDPRLQEAFNLVQQGLLSLQSLQEQTTAAHHKFLETQQQASRTLQEMMASTRQFAEAALGHRIPSPPGEDVSVPAPPTTVSPPRASEDAPAAPILRQPTPPLADATAGEAVAAASSAVESRPPEARAAAPGQDARQILLQVVSELTGYPVAMLGMEMDLEADLGIDSIKRVEILSTLEERMPSLPGATPEGMAGLRTLGEVAAFMEDAPVPSAKVATPPQAATPPQDNAPADGIQATLLAVVSELTGYPTEMLALDMDVESDLGIDSIKRVEILAALEDRLTDLPAVTPDEMAELKTLGEIAAKLDAGRPAQADPLSAAPPSTARAHGAAIETAVLTVVSELTGYPVEMLKPEMDIESDLGIDSIKRVEILATLEDRIADLRPLNPEALAPLKTLAQIIRYLDPTGPQSSDPGSRSQAEVSVAAPISSVSPLPPAPSRRTVRAVATPVAKGPRIRLAPGRRVYLTTDKTGLSHALAEALAQAGIHTVQISADILQHRDGLPEACGLIIVGDADEHGQQDLAHDRALVGHAFDLMKYLGPSLQTAARSGGAFVTTIARMDGRHGFGGGLLPHPLQGALAGLVKTAELEWEGVTCRALDIAADWQDTPRMAQAVVDILLQPGADMPIEIGLTPDTAYRLELEALAADTKAANHLDLDEDDVVVVSGGARGVTAASVMALARARKLTFILLGRSPQPFDEPIWLRDLTSVAAIKKAIIANEFENDQPTPQAVEAAYRRLTYNREISATLAAVRSAGSTVRYYDVDIGDAAKLEAVIKDARLVHGPVKALIHGAGILEDRRIEDKTAAQFARVFDTKVKGLTNLLDATADDPLRWIVLFSSVAARFGNVGQADYAAANEALNKIAQREACRRQTSRIKSINWGPWDGGMVSAALKKVFERRGIPLIPVAAGTQALLAEMGASSADAVEVIVGSERPADRDRHRPLETPPVPSDPPENNIKMHTAYQCEVSLEHYPILDDHRLGGNPVVPMALMAEWFGHGALHDHPGMLLAGIDDMRLLKGIVLDSDQPRAIRVLAAKGRPGPEGFQVPMELHNGQAPGKKLLHCRAQALVSDHLGPPPEVTIPPSLTRTGYARQPANIYADILFHGRRLQGLEHVVASSPDGMRAELATAPAPSQWIKNPARNRWIADPLIIDCAFQMASLWCYEQAGQVSLPSYLEAYRQYCRHFPSGALQAVMLARDISRHKMMADFFFLGPEQRVVAAIRGFEAVMDDQLMQAFKPGRSYAA